jgi:hypothetical protein
VGKNVTHGVSWDRPLQARLQRISTRAWRRRPIGSTQLVYSGPLDDRDVYFYLECTVPPAYSESNVSGLTGYRITED